MTRLSTPPSHDEATPLEAARRAPLARHLLIQADQFCACGYNLHGQRVSFDERLEFAVVRCPECGKWHPAGHGSTALRPWLARLATFALAVWVLLLCALGGAVFGVLLGMQFGYLSFDTTYTMVEVTSGRTVEHRMSADGTGQWVDVETGEPLDMNAFGGLESVTVPISQARGTSIYGRRAPVSWGPRAVMLGVALLVGLVAGTIQATAMWHGRGLARLIPMLIVIGAAGAIFWLIVTRSGAYHASVVFVAAIASGGMLISGAAGWLTGLLVGRPVMRAIVVGMIPPGPRMMLAFLWHADSKQMPSAKD